MATTNRVATLVRAGRVGRAKLVSRIASRLTTLNGCIILSLPVCLLLDFRAGFGLRGLWSGLALVLTVYGGTEFLIVNILYWKRIGTDEARQEDRKDSGEYSPVLFDNCEEGKST